MDVSRCLLLLSRLLSFRSRLSFFPPPRPPDLQPPACGQREELALEGPRAFHFTELPLLRGQKSRSCLQSCCREELGGGSWGGDGSGSRLLQSWKPLLQCRQSPRRARALMPGLREPGPFCGPLFRGKVLGEGSLPCAGLVPNPLPAQHSPAWP